MYPFFVFDLPENTSDQEVEQRYLQLLREYPPDRYPEQFLMIRKAYEAINTEEKRCHIQLSYIDEFGNSLTQDLGKQPIHIERKKISRSDIREMMHVLADDETL
jgi:DnaJ-class molecular chaperone